MSISDRPAAAKSYVAVSAWILSEVQSAFSDVELLDGIASVQELLKSARALLDGKDEAREKKNAGDRARRARQKTSPAKPKRGRPKSPPPALGGIIDAL